MLKFETFQDVTDLNLQPAKKKAVAYAVQINEEFRVASLEGDYAQGKAGDYLMRGVKGELYICDKTIFEESYEFV